MSFKTCAKQSLAGLKALGWVLWPNSGFCCAGHSHAEIVSRNAQLVALCPKGLLCWAWHVLPCQWAATSAWSCCQWEDPCRDCSVLLPTFWSDMGLWMAFYRAFWRLPIQNREFPDSKKAIISPRQPVISRICPGSFPSALSQERPEHKSLHRGMRAGPKADAAWIGDFVSLSSPCSLQFATGVKSDHRVFAPMLFSVWAGAGRR